MFDIQLSAIDLSNYLSNFKTSRKLLQIGTQCSTTASCTTSERFPNPFDNLRYPVSILGALGSRLFLLPPQAQESPSS